MKLSRLKTEEARKKASISPEQTFEALVEKARLILPQIIDKSKYTTHGLINMAKMKKLLGLAQTRAYDVRQALIERYFGDWGRLTNEQKEERIIDAQMGK